MGKKKRISLFQIWIFNPKWKSGSYVGKYYSKVHSTGSRVVPRFLACESFKQGAGENLKSSSSQSAVPGPAAAAAFGNLSEMQIPRLPRT